jgi:hypothetical protein
MTYFILIIFCCSVQQPKRQANIATHTLHPGRVSSRIPSPPPTLSFGWMLHKIIEWWPPKADTLSLSLFFYRLHFGTPMKDRRAARAHPTHRTIDRLIGSSGAKTWVYGGCCHEERGPKPLKGRAAVAHVGCCVLRLCFVLWLGVECCILPILQSRAPHPC